MLADGNHNSFLLLAEDESSLMQAECANYCDVNWDLSFGSDELPEYCTDWRCSTNYYQCVRSKQCIPIEWVCNGVWDCNDGSDEEAIQLQTVLSDHNSKVIMNLMQMKSLCREKNVNRPFDMLCNYTHKYPCLLVDVDESFNFTSNRPCIHLSQIGDGRVDCYGSLDERNLIACSSHKMLGFNFKCEHGRELVDKYCIPQVHHCEWRCLNNEDKYLCFYLLNNLRIPCNKTRPVAADMLFRDVYCLNKTCIENARCNGIPQCEYGEDEYYFSIRSLPQLAIDFVGIQEAARHFSRQGWLCNRGVAIGMKDTLSGDKSIACFCPPSTYGHYSMCRPSYRGLFYDDKPLCQCSMNRYGPGCFIPRQCDMFNGRNLCLNGGTCYIQFEPDNTVEDYICLCRPSYFGNHCQHNSGKLELRYIKSMSREKQPVIASVLQLYDISDKTWNLIMKKQNVYTNELTSHTEFIRDQLSLPILGLLKLHFSPQISPPAYYLLYVKTNHTYLNLSMILNEKNHCRHTHTIFNLDKTQNSTTTVGSGYYLFVHSLTSQLSLMFLLLKVIHVLLGTKGMIWNSLWNTIWCKLVSFILSAFTRISYWLTGLVTIERLYVILYPKGLWLKKPAIAKHIILIIVVLTLGSHVHELVEYYIVQDPKYSEHGTWCVTQFSTVLSIYNQVNIFIHYSIPVLINFISTFISIILIARKRANATRNKTQIRVFREQLQKQKELFIPSLLILLCSLPQFIISFSLACTELNVNWQRYSLTVAYFLSYAPQVSSYFLYIQPSTMYKEQFLQTYVGKKLRK
ncbi:unnamed protein product [Didymodactylos carnosus]|uniref:G-protein coupled receptors family 1 profile domain-containing protein n=1 Tax=Didymodactylos carnosus TaxID=1234261 RepID=A0A814F7S3_9BILA|nr:unnamed protein product [Didymodactylos carnosus]CAF3751899.1 unnamed protein product [Didymodactylos carnosus]